MENFKLFFLIVAAGKGARMSSSKKKQYLPINNIPVLTHTLRVFHQYNKTNKMILVIPDEDIDYVRENILKFLGIEDKITLVPGGKERNESVFNGINAIKTMADDYKKSVILIHDGVRPFINSSLIDACIKGAIEHGACVPGLKIVDTLKVVNNNTITKTLDRSNVYQIQTPQAFVLDIIIKAMEFAENKNFFGTDDASIVEFFGHKVFIIKGLKHNIKITTKDDLKFANEFYN